MKTISLIGAGGHARSVISLLHINNFHIEALYDEAPGENELIFHIPVRSLKSLSDSRNLVLSIGDNFLREKSFQHYRNQVVDENIAHPNSLVESHTKLGVANLILANCYINCGVEIGHNNILNTASILEHEVKIGSHCHVAVGAILLGRAQVGDRCFIGSGSIIRDGIKICDDVTIGANSFVSENISEPGTYIGSPARRLK
jgi:UDP-N-acetylbacillosamine N-acetyltransferase